MAESLKTRLNRLLLMVPYLLNRPGIKVEDVCRTFEITREQLVMDASLLFVCGLPGYGPGDLIEAYIDGDEVIVRTADYFSKPPRMTYAEGLLLYSGAKAMEAAGVDSHALDRALKRLEEVLGPEALERVQVGLPDLPALRDLRKALEGKKRVRLTYWAHSRNETTERSVDPWGLFASTGHWYLAGYCHKADDRRLFRVDRMREVKVLDEDADVPEDLDLSSFEGLYIKAPGAERVVLELSPGSARWVQEYYPLEGTKRIRGGWVRIELTAGGVAWLERLLLRLGKEARVVEPEWLRDRVQALACRVLEVYRGNAPA